MADANEPHPDAQAFLEQMEEAPPLHTLPPAEARAGHRQMNVAEGEPEAVGSVDDIAVRGDGHGIPVRVYTPEGDGPFPVLVWAHGGGFVLGDIDTEDATARALTNATGCLVASVDYRLAPEHKFPAALRDMYAVTRWATEGAGEYGGDTDRVAVGGSSAGGALAAGTALYARDHDGPDIDYQVLIYPVTSYSQEFPSHEEYDGYFLYEELLDWFDDLYFDDPIHGHNPYAHPLEAPDLSGLPPATVVTAGFDPLQDEGKAYADALEEAGVSVSHHHFEGMIHAFMDQLQAPEWERARDCVAQVGDDVKAGLE